MVEKVATVGRVATAVGWVAKVGQGAAEEWKGVLVAMCCRVC